MNRESSVKFGVFRNVKVAKQKCIHAVAFFFFRQAINSACSVFPLICSTRRSREEAQNVATPRTERPGEGVISHPQRETKSFAQVVPAHFLSRDTKRKTIE